MSLHEFFAAVAGSRKFEYAGWQAASLAESGTCDSKPETETEGEPRGGGLLVRLLGDGGAQQGGDSDEVSLVFFIVFFSS